MKLYKISTPIQLALIGIIVILVQSYLPLPLKSSLLSISLAVKELIVFLLPALIFLLIFKSTASLAHKATPILTWILLGVCVSNFIATTISLIPGHFVYSFDLNLIKPAAQTILQPLFNFKLPTLVSNDVSLMVSSVIGIFMGKKHPQKAAYFAQKADKITHSVFDKLPCVIPVFFTGFMIKITHEGTLFALAAYLKVLAVIVCAALSHIVLLYIIGAQSPHRAWQRIRGFASSLISGFTTMSSAATLPVMFQDIFPHVRSKPLAQATLPSTINIHLIGDCFAIPVLSLAVMKSFALPLPDLFQFMKFIGYFVLAKFSVAAIPGGGMFVMLPILSSVLNFTTPMLSLCTALYILFDPIITALNILGNGALAFLADRFLYKKISQ